MATPRRIVTLVHGTDFLGWFRRPNPAWIQEQGAFARALRVSLNDPGLIVEPFRWDGGNSLSSRHAASEALRRHARRVRTRYPGAHHYVIAHSHGGNVALHALGGSERSVLSDGIACLSTPFLTARRRDVGVGRHSGWYLAAFLISVLFFNMVWRAVPEWQVYGTVAVVGAALIALRVLVSRFVDRRVQKLIADFKPPAIVPEHLLIVRADGDEALDALGAAHALSTLITRAWIRFASVAALAAAAGKRANEMRLEHKTALWLTGVADFILVVITDSWARGTQDIFVFILILLVLLGIGLFENTLRALAFVAGAISGLLILPVVVATGLTALAVGPEIVMCALALDISGEATPAGVWTVHSFDSPIERLSPANDNEMPELAHSSYNDRRVVERVAEWMRDRDQTLIIGPASISSATNFRGPSVGHST